MNHVTMDDRELQPVAPPIGGLTSTQRRRRTRIIAQALEFAGGGYEAVNVRLVAERAGVAVGTLYHYFPTKQHLLLSAFGEWLERFQRHLEHQFGRLDDGFARVWQVLELLTNAMREIPLLADTVARSFIYAEDTTAGEVDAIRSQMAEMFADVLSGGWPTESERNIGALLTDVLTSNLLALAHQRITLDEVANGFRRSWASWPSVTVPPIGHHPRQATCQDPLRFAGSTTLAATDERVAIARPSSHPNAKAHPNGHWVAKRPGSFIGARRCPLPTQ
jgi:AcrR family transcriptional regulator